ncbi:aminotransferase class I/II-fold pyridoxal phosphate-dependent enzyme [Spongiactinospora sp. 9N601]|uniref:aminotransferase class I/II-fold pyridoxal phosphate-dependent enzyme n=1 Tax=Spongiactinospora sp. 9N601 TaxID=3375149 RepID=UPI003791D038
MSDNAILAISARAARLRAEGAAVISLAAGEPDLPTPSHITDTVARIAGDPALHHYGGAAGLPGLRALAAARLAEATGLPWNAGDVQITLGAKHALALALQAVLDPGDQVLVTTPGWPGHHGVIEAAGGVARTVRAGADAGFLATPDDLARARTPRTRALILAGPGNPTGAVYPRAALAEIADWALRHDLWCITDDIYQEFVYDAPHTALLAAAPHARQRCIMINGVSKAHAMTGWRVGWLAGPASVLARASRAVSRTITHVPLITQAAAEEALSGGRASVRAAHDRYRANRDILHEALNSLPGVDCPLPAGGFYVFPSVAGLLARHSGRWSSASDLAAWLLETAHVAVVPGEVFGAPDRLRIGFAVSGTAMAEAIDRLRRALGHLT